jgi:hypothetical protein
MPTSGFDASKHRFNLIKMRPAMLRSPEPELIAEFFDVSY